MHGKLKSFEALLYVQNKQTYYLNSLSLSFYQFCFSYSAEGLWKAEPMYLISLCLLSAQFPSGFCCKVLTTKSNLEITRTALAVRKTRKNDFLEFVKEFPVAVGKTVFLERRLAFQTRPYATQNKQIRSHRTVFHSVKIRDITW